MEAKMLQSIEEVGMERGMERGMEIGLEKGRVQTLEEVTKNMLKSGKLTRKEIARFTGMKLTEINKLAKTMKKG